MTIDEKLYELGRLSTDIANEYEQGGLAERFFDIALYAFDLAEAHVKMRGEVAPEAGEREEA